MKIFTRKLRWLELNIETTYPSPTGQYSITSIEDSSPGIGLASPLCFFGGRVLTIIFSLKIYLMILKAKAQIFEAGTDIKSNNNGTDTCIYTRRRRSIDQIQCLQNAKGVWLEDRGGIGAGGGLLLYGANTEGWKISLCLQYQRNMPVI